MCYLKFMILEILGGLSFILTHWGRVAHICVGNLTSIGSDNGFSPDRRQAIIWTNAGILWIALLGINLSEILIGIQTFSFNKNVFENVVWKIAAMLSWPQCCKWCLYVLVKISQHWVRLGLIACLMPSHYLQQCWIFLARPLATIRYINMNRLTLYVLNHSEET